MARDYSSGAANHKQGPYPPSQQFRHH